MVFLKRQASIHFFRFNLNEYFYPFKDIKLHLIRLVSNNDPTINKILKYMRFFCWANLLVKSNDAIGCFLNHKIANSQDLGFPKNVSRAKFTLWGNLMIRRSLESHLK